MSTVGTKRFLHRQKIRRQPLLLAMTCPEFGSQPRGGGTESNFLVRRNNHQTVNPSISCHSRLWAKKRGSRISRDLEPQSKWQDDTTFVVDTIGLDERTWIDNVGRPHSDELKVTETWHRVDHDIMELTLTITDPKMYTKPWNALNKFRMRLQPADFDLREMLCSPSEQAEYDKLVSKPTIATRKK